MATNKHAIIRYRVIDRCLRQVDRQWTWKELRDACTEEIEKHLGQTISLSERTIKGDLSTMRTDETLAYFAPIEYDRKEKSYYYADRNYSISESMISKKEAQELRSTIQLIRQITGFSYLEGLDNILHKLELLVYESINQDKPIVQLEQPSTIPGQQWLDTIYRSIRDEKTLTLRYRPFEKEASNVLVSPLLLKEYQHRWFLFAMNNTKQGLRVYGLERIEEIQESHRPYLSTQEFDPSTYFNDIIGITLEPGRKKETIIWEAYGREVQYLRTKPLHHSQKEIYTDKKLSRFQMEVIPNYELKSLLRSFGPAVKVLQPQDLI